ncbi:hypothetical protein BDP27DRAFT_1337417 [Rhodocollybia butyracea]|uniref:Inactive metallocarboxypeptidase ECM14 n=1 Tax=Rhodocollybia butyracea TaxID=206335 RepID=A0A9P5U123_9AGAR|nr:hypothetical protein BDP27DRAFT_1337417 [Rhodocollybia butyracea]
MAWISAIFSIVLTLVSVFLRSIAQNTDQQVFNLDNPNPRYREEASLLGGSRGTLRRFSNPDTLSAVVGVAESHDLDIWQITANYVDIYFPSQTELPEELKKISYTEEEINATRDIDAWKVSSSTFGVSSEWNLSTIWPDENEFHSNYHPSYEIDMFIYELAEGFPGMVQVVHLGHSAEEREMLGIKLSKRPPKNLKPNVAKQSFVIMGAQHAREWVATATSLYLAHSLVTSLEHLLNHYDFYIIPNPNPDGYTYTWEFDRFWYKNRQIMGPNEKCTGLDMGRNWGYKWKDHATGGGDNFDDEYLQNKDDTPVDPCSHWYPGHRAFESPEVNNIANFITTLSNRKAFLDLRTYGQMLSPPYSYSCTVYPRESENQFEAAIGAAQALGRVHGTKVRVGTLCEQLYQAPGNVIDWMYKKSGIEYSYAVHLRDTGTYGFSLPAEWIRPVGEETAAMVQYLANFIQGY